MQSENNSDKPLTRYQKYSERYKRYSREHYAKNKEIHKLKTKIRTQLVSNNPEIKERRKFHNSRALLRRKERLLNSESPETLSKPRGRPKKYIEQPIILEQRPRGRPKKIIEQPIILEKTSWKT
jgi:hypothetical protein